MLELIVVLNAVIVLGLWLGIISALLIIGTNELYRFLTKEGKRKWIFLENK